MQWYKMRSCNNYNSKVLNNGNSWHHHYLCLKKSATESIPCLFLTLEVKILFWVSVKLFYSWIASLGTCSVFLHQSYWYSKGHYERYIFRELVIFIILFHPKFYQDDSFIFMWPNCSITLKIPLCSWLY